MSSFPGGKQHTLTSKLTVKYGRSLKSFEFETSQPTTQTSRQAYQQSFMLQEKWCKEKKKLLEKGTRD